MQGGERGDNMGKFVQKKGCFSGIPSPNVSSGRKTWFWDFIWRSQKGKTTAHLIQYLAKYFVFKANGWFLRYSASLISTRFTKGGGIVMIAIKRINSSSYYPISFLVFWAIIVFVHQLTLHDTLSHLNVKQRKIIKMNINVFTYFHFLNGILIKCTKLQSCKICTLQRDFVIFKSKTNY